MLLMIITCVFSHFLTGTRIISRFIKSIVPSLTYLSTIEQFHDQRQPLNCTFASSLTLQCANQPSLPLLLYCSLNNISDTKITSGLSILQEDLPQAQCS